MPSVIGEAVATAQKQVTLAEALQDTLNKAPAFPHTDSVHFRVSTNDVEFGGIVGSTKTRVTVDVEPGPLEDHGIAKGSFNSPTRPESSAAYRHSEFEMSGACRFGAGMRRKD